MDSDDSSCSENVKRFNLYNSAFCRLCCDKNNCGINLFKEKFDNEDLSTLINMYLPIKVIDDGRYPQTICPGCHIQLQATISFFNMLISGQKKLRELLIRNINRSESESEYLNEDLPEQSEQPLYDNSHNLYLKAAGIDLHISKRGRGRPRKTPLPYIVPPEFNPKDLSAKNIIETSDIRSKRRRKFPVRLEEAISGQELEDAYAEEGLISFKEIESPMEVNDKGPEVIGHVCGESGQDLAQVVIHSNNQILGQKRTAVQFKCNICGNSFNHESKLHKHVAEIHSNKNKTDISNNINSEIENKLEDLEKKNAKYNCKLCDKKFRLGSSLKGHMLSRHSTSGNIDHSSNSTIYPCESCDKKFFHLSSLSYHKEAVHSNGKIYACSKCNKTFKHRQLLQRHQTVHSELRAYFCDKCDSSFKTKANLTNHLACHSKDKKFYCHTCGHQFAYKASLRLHIRTHMGEKPFQCAICKKKFTQKGNLNEHMRTHTGEKPYECHVCNRNFTTSSQFKLHFKRHTGYKPWKCEYCGKGFLHKNIWRCHLRRHRGEKPFACKFCEKTFPELWALKKHTRIHTGEKPYSCPICNKTFSDCSNLRKHKNVHAVNGMLMDTTKWKSPEIKNEKLKEPSNVNINEKMWTIIDDSDSAINTTEQQIIYLTYENTNDINSELSEKLVIERNGLEELATKKEIENEIEVQVEAATRAADGGGDNANNVNTIFLPTMQVMVESNNQMKFASDGTLYQVTTMDGEPLQVDLGDDIQFPLTIATNGDSIIHQLKPLANIPIVEDIGNGIAVTSRPTEGIEFVADDQHLKLISELNSAALNLSSEYLEIV